MGFVVSSSFFHVAKLQSKVDPESKEDYAKYLALWKEGRFILQSKTFAEEFSGSRNPKRKVPFEPLLKSNHKRMKVPFLCFTFFQL